MSKGRHYSLGKKFVEGGKVLKAGARSARRWLAEARTCLSNLDLRKFILWHHDHMMHYALALFSSTSSRYFCPCADLKQHCVELYFWDVLRSCSLAPWAGNQSNQSYNLLASNWHYRRVKTLVNHWCGSVLRREMPGSEAPLAIMAASWLLCSFF